jgi:hypothetical protein
VIDYLGGGDNYDKFYDENGNLVHDDHVGNRSWIVSRIAYQQALCAHSDDCLAISDELRNGGALQAYPSEGAAAAAWAPQGHSATRQDNIERGNSIFHARGIDGCDLYVNGSTVKGIEPTSSGVRGEVKAEASTAMIDGINLLEVRAIKWTWIGVRKYDDWEGIPLWADRKEISHYQWFPLQVVVWKRTALNHTHPPGQNSDVFSASPGDFLSGSPIAGDIGAAIGGYNVYLVPTSSKTASVMYKLSAAQLKNYWTDNIYKAMDYWDARKETYDLNCY